MPVTVIEKYRACKNIEPRNGRCQNDGIRVWPKKGGGWYHDATEIRIAAQRHEYAERHGLL